MIPAFKDSPFKDSPFPVPRSPFLFIDSPFLVLKIAPEQRVKENKAY